jgi:hypothetical protein
VSGRVLPAPHPVLISPKIHFRATYILQLAGVGGGMGTGSERERGREREREREREGERERDPGCHGDAWTALDIEPFSTSTTRWRCGAAGGSQPRLLDWREQPDGGTGLESRAKGTPTFISLFLST